MLLRNGLFFADGHFWENLCVRLETGRVTAMGEGLAPLAGEAVIDPVSYTHLTLPTKLEV